MCRQRKTGIPGLPLPQSVRRVVLKIQRDVKGVALCCVLCLVGEQPLCSQVLSGNSQVTNSPSDLLKWLIAAEPESGRIAFTIQHLVGLPVGSSKAAVPLESYESRWQSNSCYVVQFSRGEPNDHGAILDLGGIVSNTYWHVFNNKVRVWQEENATRETNNVKACVDHLRGIASYVMHFGIAHKPGSLRWYGNKFSAVALNGATMDGELTTSQEGLPDHLYFQCLGAKVAGCIDFAYAERGTTAVELPIPESFVSNAIDEHQEKHPAQSTTIKTFALNAPFSPIGFTPQQFVGVSATNTLVYSNNSVYYFDNSNHMQKVVTSSARAPLFKRSVLLVIMVCVTTAFAAWAFLTAKSSNSIKQNKRKDIQ